MHPYAQLYAPAPPQILGEQVNVAIGTYFPPLCVKCGAHGPLVPRAQRYRWFPPWTYALLLAGLLPGALVQMALTKTADLLLPICAPCDSRWTASAVMRVLSMVAPVVLGLGLMMLGARPGGLDILVAGAAVLVLGIIILPITVHFAMILPRQVLPTFIDDYRITLRGVAPQVLVAFQGGPLPQVQMPYGRGY